MPRFLVPALLAALCATALAAVPAPPAAVAAGPSSVTLEGRGYGHGKGMSQWGAQGAASEQGRTYRQILRFYYPRTGWGRAAGKIKVLITGDTSDDVLVRNTGDLRLRRVADGRTWALGKAPRQWRLTAADGGRSTTLWKRTDRWRPVRTVRGEAEILGRSVALVTPDGVTRYQGAVRSAVAGSRRDTVNVVPLEAYLRGVVPLEVPALWHPHAVRAQAVAARTYAAFERRDRGGHFDVHDTTQSQVYGGVSAAHPASDSAIRRTRGQVLVHGGRPAFTQFSASNGGWTVDGGRPYLVAKQDPWDSWRGNPNRRWQVTVRAAAIEEAFPHIGDFRRLGVVERDGNGAWGGRALEVRIVGSRATATPTGDTFRSIFGLRSTWFRVR